LQTLFVDCEDYPKAQREVVHRLDLCEPNISTTIQQNMRKTERGWEETFGINTASIFARVCREGREGLEEKAGFWYAGLACPDNVRDIPDGNALVDEERVKDIALVSAVFGVNGERGVGCA
jgi:hypothetical protein